MSAETIDNRHTRQSRKSLIVLDGDKWKVRKTYLPRQGGNGFGLGFGEVVYTLNTIDRHIVALLNDCDCKAERKN